jgi:hypothetical protein
MTHDFKITPELFPPLDADLILSAAGPSGPERLFAGIPMLSIVSNVLWHKRHMPIHDAYSAELARRPSDCASAWGDDPTLLVVVRAVQAAAEVMGWTTEEAQRILPWDPFRVPFWSFFDGCDLDLALMEMGDRIFEDPKAQRRKRIRAFEDRLALWYYGDLATLVDDLLQARHAGKLR